MDISDVDQEVSDIIWFAIDSEFNIANFYSSGGRLPPSVTMSKEDNEKLIDFFDSQDIQLHAFKINDNVKIPYYVPEHVSHKNFFEPYAHYSARGLFSFSRNEENVDGLWSDYEYDLMTIPMQPLIYNNLPRHIQEIISKTKYNGTFGKSNAVDRRNIS